MSAVMLTYADFLQTKLDSEGPWSMFNATPSSTPLPVYDKNIIHCVRSNLEIRFIRAKTRHPSLPPNLNQQPRQTCCRTNIDKSRKQLNPQIRL